MTTSSEENEKICSVDQMPCECVDTGRCSSETRRMQREIRSAELYTQAAIERIQRALEVYDRERMYPKPELREIMRRLEAVYSAMEELV